MAKNKFNGETANANRLKAGSERGLAGRKYPIDIATKMNDGGEFAKRVCAAIGKNVKDFLKAEAGPSIPARAKVNLRIIWKDGSVSSFRVKTARASQIHLELPKNFIAGYEARFESIPKIVKEALLLFTGHHPKQKEILDSISVNYVGDRIRDLERKYNNRLTLASMHGYSGTMPHSLLNWFRLNIVNIFIYCFSCGNIKDSELTADYIWYHDTDDIEDDFQIFSIADLSKRLSRLSRVELQAAVKPNDQERVGSTIALPFGNLQYHLSSLQFRHDPSKLIALSKINTFRNNFGSKPKISGHKNEIMIAEELNDNAKFRAHFCDRVGRKPDDFVSARADGVNAKHEESVLGGKTTGKTDLIVQWKNGDKTNISIKKCSAGQVYLVTAKNFVAAYEAQYNVIIPSKVRRALAFFIGEDPESRAILDATDISVDGEKARKVAIESNYRLMFDVIRNYDSRMADELLSFLKKDVADIFELCFAAGAVKDRSLWSNVLWYKNLVDSDGEALDYLIPIPVVKAALLRLGDCNKVYPGPQNAGSTIHMPFGHLQYHSKQLEFYQKLAKIQTLIASE